MEQFVPMTLAELTTIRMFYEIVCLKIIFTSICYVIFRFFVPCFRHAYETETNVQ